jgi:thiol-disulfide isomerase/thioredoxin
LALHAYFRWLGLASAPLLAHRQLARYAVRRTSQAKFYAGRVRSLTVREGYFGNPPNDTEGTHCRDSPLSRSGYGHGGGIDMSNSPAQSSKWITLGLIGSAIVLIAAIATALMNNKDGSVVSTDGQPLAGGATAPNAPAGSTELPAGLSEASFKTLDGSSKRLADYKGKVVIVDLWATWCGPCRQEIPHLIELANTYRDKGVEVVGLTNENPETDAQAVRAFSQQFKINYPIGWADPTMATNLMRINGRGGIPQTFVIGKDGKVKGKFVGFHPAISPPQIKAALDQAINES